jgi:hypothetical protein
MVSGFLNKLLAKPVKPGFAAKIQGSLTSKACLSKN